MRLALLGDKRFLMDPDGRGFVMYARSGGSLVSMGEPVGGDEAVTDLAWAFRGLADRTGTRTCSTVWVRKGCRCFWTWD